MKKGKILELFPLRKEIRHELRSLKKQRDQLDHAIEVMENTVNELEWITLYKDFPLEIIKFSGNNEIEIWAGCSEVHRYAYVCREEGDTFSAFGYRNNNGDGRRLLVEGVTQAKAMKAAKEWVAFNLVPGQKMVVA